MQESIIYSAMEVGVLGREEKGVRTCLHLILPIAARVMAGLPEYDVHGSGDDPKFVLVHKRTHLEMGASSLAKLLRGYRPSSKGGLPA